MTSALRGSHFLTALQLEEIKAVVAVNDHCSHYASVIEFAKMIDDGPSVVDHRSARDALVFNEGTAPLALSRRSKSESRPVPA
jgi:L-ascorbate metabolism protein UlaG (beta-lactamase superfamily)